MYLNQVFHEYSLPERIAVVKELADYFNSVAPKAGLEQEGESDEVSQLLSVLLGKKISLSDLSSQELVDKFALSLNTIFNTLNEIVIVINTTLLGKKDELETIRQIIGSNLEQEEAGRSLQAYLDQIKNAFLIAHQAFRQSVQNKISELLHELDPEHIATFAEGSLKFGPLKKAELFEIYMNAFEKCRKVFESGRLMEDFSKEFEKICEKLCKMKTREVS
jgi:hypothetical protein